jgi:hypothetical protein
MEEYQYLSPEWAEEAFKRLKSDLTAEEMKFVTSSMLTVYRNCPDGVQRAVYYSYMDGVIEELSVSKIMRLLPEFRALNWVPVPL